MEAIRKAPCKLWRLCSLIVFNFDWRKLQAKEVHFDALNNKDHINHQKIFFKGISYRNLERWIAFCAVHYVKKASYIYFNLFERTRFTKYILYFDFGKILDIIIKIKGYAMMYLGRLNWVERIHNVYLLLVS